MTHRCPWGHGLSHATRKEDRMSRQHRRQTRTARGIATSATQKTNCVQPPIPPAINAKTKLAAVMKAATNKHRNQK